MNGKHKRLRCTGEFNDFFFDTVQTREKSSRQVGYERAGTVVVLLFIFLATTFILTGVL